MVWGGEKKGGARAGQGQRCPRETSPSGGSSSARAQQDRAKAGGSPSRILLEEGEVQKRRREDNENFSPGPVFVFPRGC